MKDKHKGKWRRRFFILCFFCFALFFLIVVLRLWPHETLKEQFSYSRVVEAENGRLLRITLAQDDHYRIWLDLNDISPSIKESVLLKEDRYFYYHPGVNPIALGRAVFETYSADNKQGASTLSMQLARRIYNINSRSISGKIKQIFASLWIEARYSKDEILEAYLNFAPMGGNIDGVEAASQIYFHKSARNISLNEAIALAVLPQSPTIRAKFGADMQSARLRLINEWLECYKNDIRNNSLNQLPVVGYNRKDLPFLAPHYTDYLLANYSNNVLRGTLDYELQSNLERITKTYVTQRQRLGLKNTAVLLVDTRDMGIKAMVGSADFFNSGIHGQVNGTTSRRSPGSTIKPFLYALAIDQGIIHPMTILKDAPTSFGSFRPQNYDGQFEGPISAQDALVKSRNIPAVYLAHNTRNPTLYQFLYKAGVSALRPEESYGLSIALGGGEMKMIEMASLYALLAHDGRLRSLRYIEDEKVKIGDELISPAAAFITRNMLYQHKRPDGLPPDRRGKNWRVAWKTGTSWSYHDGWAAGIVGPYVLIVWTGNFDNSGPTSFIGFKTAAPLFFRIVDSLPSLKPDIKLNNDTPPATVKRVDVCIASGELPNEWCPQTRKTWFIPGVSPIKISTLHQPVIIDNKTGKVACPPYNLKDTHIEVYEFWPSDLKRLFDLAGLPRRSPPQSNCAYKAPVNTADAPQIRYPVQNVSYVLKTNKKEDTIPLQADAGANVKFLYWFSGKQFLGQTKPGEVLEWRPLFSGNQQLRVTNDRGVSTNRTIRVEFIP